MIMRFRASRRKRTEHQKKFTNMNIRYVIESCDGFKWEEEYYFDSYTEAKIEIDKMRSSINTRKYRIIRQQSEVIEDGSGI
jgi:hypothetical protein